MSNFVSSQFINVKINRMTFIAYGINTNMIAASSNLVLWSHTPKNTVVLYTRKKDARENLVTKCKVCAIEATVSFLAPISAADLTHLTNQHNRKKQC